MTITIIDADDLETTVPGYRVDDRLLVDGPRLTEATGWTLKPEGLCRDETCVPTGAWPDLTHPSPADGAAIDLALFGLLTQQPVVVDAIEGVVAFGTSAERRSHELASLDAPGFTVDDLDGEPVSLSDFKGQKKMLVAFASWCGCRYDLPAWQSMHADLADHGFTAIGVAVDEDPDDVREWVEGVEFPVVLDRDHVITDRYDIRNVPTVVWIDENDRVVRPQDVAFGSDMFKDFHGIDSNPHHEQLKRWVTTGELPLATDEVAEHVVTPTDEEQLARVHWRVAIALHRRDLTDAAARHFAAAAELAPLDLTINRSSMPLRGIDPFLSDEFIALYEAYNTAGRPGYGFEHAPFEM